MLFWKSKRPSSNKEHGVGRPSILTKADDNLASKNSDADMELPLKAADSDFDGRFREIISDPINILIDRVPKAGCVSGELVMLHNGLQVPIGNSHAYAGDFSRILIYNRGVHEPLEEFVFQEVLKLMPNAPIMLELGSYWAHYSMWLKIRRQSACLIMVEPETIYLEVGRSNFARNDLAGEFIQDFVDVGRFEVDKFFRSRAFKYLDILHVDIQGFEEEMLVGAEDTLKRHLVDHIFISTHSQKKHLHVADQLKRLGYRLEISSDFDSHSTSNDGFIYASNPANRPTFPNFRPLGRTEIVASSSKEILRNMIAVNQYTNS
ncbi:FkbM family methyltransferase [Methylobacterium sp. J-030]|uniref:FkbM family methyltransferase n=1 Tax=Methylobacterium sp. J-030 TaxID=2836627 RepID=UPI001FBA2576|nr:FkbM family methyltransferase [Methylobacterium sp. J-030]MCJ2073091.1 FkbM family methyltransferase [Methylobacterium sp. J-030]